jgi:mRNA interferase MazF
MRAGEIYLCDFGTPVGHEPGYPRPALIVSDNRINVLGLPFVIPITSTPRRYPTRIEIDGVLPKVSCLECEQLRSISDKRLIKRLGTVDESTLAYARQILRNLLGL